MAEITDGNLPQKDPLNVSIKILGISTLDVISRLLNPTKFIPTEDRLSRDWQGLAALINLNAEEVSNLILERNPTLCVLRIWCEKQGGTIRNLLLLLEKLDRFDVIDDISDLLETDLSNYLLQSTKSIGETQQYILAYEDISAYEKGLPPVTFDACILYANEDVDFASTVIEKLETAYEPRLKIFVKERDLVAGAIEHDAFLKVIARRCNRLIVILSPAFLRSSENFFFISFAQSIGIDQRRRKIIPCIYIQCEIPAELKPLHKLDYTRAGPLFNFWEKLHKSVLTPIMDPSLDPTKSNRSRNNSNLVSHDEHSTVDLRSESSVVEEAVKNVSATNLSQAPKSKMSFRSILKLPRSLIKRKKADKVPSQS